MAAVALTSTLYEIWEMTLAVLLLLVISAGILYVHSPDSVHAKTLANEISYISSIKGDKNYQISLDIEKSKEILIENYPDKNTVSVNVGNTVREKKYIGTNIKIVKNDNFW